MKDRIRQIMEAQHMTQKVFAQFIGMSEASLSSIFNERTKPTLNVVEAIKKKIPDISTDWLMFGSGTMYVSDKVQSVAPENEAPVESLLDFSDMTSPTPSSVATDFRPSAPSQINGVRSTHPVSARIEVKNVDKPPRRVTEIRVFYDDQTWESFVPAKKTN